MTSIAKLKDRARKHEQKEDWKAAIGVYQQVLEAEEGEDELDLELGLYNRIGDLYLRLGRTDDAVSYYEQAADKYAEAGFLNNAIALCNKALRHRPERPQLYLKLSGLCLEQGFIIDARRWILDYAEREVRAGRADAALSALSDFVESSDDLDVREFLAQQLATHDRQDEAVRQFARAHAERLQRGENDSADRLAEKAREIDPGVDLASAVAAHDAAAPEEELGAPAGLEAGIAGDSLEDEGDEGGLAGLETRPDGGLAGAEAEEVDGGLEGLEVSYSEQESPDVPEETDASIGGLETFGSVGLDDALGGDEAGEEPGAGVDPVPPDSVLDDEDDPDPLPLVEGTGEEHWDEAPEEDAEPLPLLDTGLGEGGEDDEEAGAVAEDEAPEPLDLEDFGLGGESEEVTAEEATAEEATAEEATAEEPVGDLDLDLELGPGAEEQPAEEPEEAAAAAAAAEEPAETFVEEPTDTAFDESAEEPLDQAAETPFEEPADAMGALQQRVEEAETAGDQELLVSSYLELASALEEQGAETKARAMYQRVLDVDPENETARAAVGEPEGGDQESIDLDAILQEMAPEEAAALREGPLPDASEDPEFAAMLSQFKARVAERVDTEDAGDHYDLGLAFKEMGLIDEAIAEFQTALTGGEERLKVYEELGQCFMQKGQYTVALKVLNRALQVPHQDESELLGVHYHLGQCHEELGDREAAREAYQKVLDIDPAFQDVPDRVARL